MTERPILMSGAMVRACLAGTKTQTRRVVMPPPDEHVLHPERPAHSPFQGEDGIWRWMTGKVSRGENDRRCPYGQPGSRLWVRETWAMQAEYCIAYREGGECGAWIQDGAGGWSWLHHGWIANVADGRDGRYYDLNRYGGKWRPSIFMPRWACRLVLEVTGVRVERLRDISVADCWAEGIEPGPVPAKQQYQRLWDSLNASRGYGWAVNPFVWVVSFRRAEKAQA